MSMADRERAQLQTTQVSVPTESYLAEIADHLDTIRSYQGVLTDKLNKVSKETTDSLKSSNTIISELKTVLNGVQHAMINLKKDMERVTNTQEKELQKATQEVRQLKTDLINGLLQLRTHEREPLSHKLYRVATIAGSSILGGLVIFLVLKVITKH